MEFTRINDEIFLRSKPHMGEDVPFSARRLVWPPPEHAKYTNNPDPHLPTRARPPLLPAQPWKDYDEVYNSLYRFYNDVAWGTDPAHKAEMLGRLRQWGADPSLAHCWSTPSWPRCWEVSTHSLTLDPRP